MANAINTRNMKVARTTEAQGALEFSRLRQEHLLHPRPIASPLQVQEGARALLGMRGREESVPRRPTKLQGSSSLSRFSLVYWQAMLRASGSRCHLSQTPKLG